jgi:hypothetical protein
MADHKSANILFSSDSMNQGSTTQISLQAKNFFHEPKIIFYVFNMCFCATNMVKDKKFWLCGPQ